MADDDNFSVSTLDISEDTFDITEDGINDDDFGIPHLNDTETPSIDNILADEDILPPDIAQDITWKGSTGSLDPSLNISNVEDPAEFGSMVRHLRLKGISGNIEAAEGRGGGLPSALAVNTLVAIGTTHGLVMLFDARQILRLYLTPPNDTNEEVGAVSCLSLTESRLLVGHDLGTIHMWDITGQGRLLRTHRHLQPILHVRFTRLSTMAVMSDTTGSAYALSFHRPLGVRTTRSRCLFSGSRGEAVAIEPLLVGPSNKILFALASFSKLFFIQLKPTFKTIYVRAWAGDKRPALPVLAWHETFLLVARDTRIWITAVTAQGKMRPLQQISTPTRIRHDISSVVWLSARALAIIDSNEMLHLLDPASERRLESLDLNIVRCVTSAASFKALATGGQVSPALESVSSKARYYTFGSKSGGQMLALGLKGLHVIALRSWRERLAMVRSQPKKAMRLLRWLHETGELVSDTAAEIVVEWANGLSLPDAQPPSDEETRVCVETCLIVGKSDVLYNDVYDYLPMQSRRSMLAALEMWIISSELTYVAPRVLSDMVSHLAEVDPDRLETVITRLDPNGLDVDGLVRLSWSLELYNALIYIYNRALQDYISPAREMLSRLVKLVKENASKNLNNSSQESHRVLGNKLLVYLSCCLAGRDFTYGNMPSDVALSVRKAIFQLLLGCDQYGRYTNMATLLHFETCDFLNVLSIAFEEPQFKSVEGQRVRQAIINILIDLIMNSSTEGFSADQQGSLLMFLAQQLTRCGNLTLPDHLTHEVVSHLVKGKHENLLIEMFVSGILSCEDNQLEAILIKSRMYSVLEIIYEKRGLPHLTLRCYLEPRRPALFRFVRNILYQRDCTEEQRRLVISEVRRNLAAVVYTDQVKAAQLLVAELEISPSEIVSELRSDSLLQLEFLTGVIELKASPKNRELVIENPLIDLYVRLLYKHRTPEDIFKFLKKSDVYSITAIINICQEYHLDKCIAYLHIKSGNVVGGCRLLVKAIDAKFRLLLNTEAESEQSCKEDVQFEDVLDFVNLLVQTLQKQQMLVDDAEALWFSLLDSLVMPFKASSSGEHVFHHEVALKELIFNLLNSMIGHISLPKILTKIIEEPAYGTGSFGEVKELIFGMLATCNYEETLLALTNKIITHDVHWNFDKLRRTYRRGIRPIQTICQLCTKNISSVAMDDTVAVFSCGHAFHGSCLRQFGYVIETGDQDVEPQYFCSICRHDRDPMLTPSISLEAVAEQFRQRSTSYIQRTTNVQQIRKAQRRQNNKSLYFGNVASTPSSGFFESESFQLCLKPRKVF